MFVVTNPSAKALGYYRQTPTREGVNQNKFDGDGEN
jgi:hypothetical protein